MMSVGLAFVISPERKSYKPSIDLLFAFLLPINVAETKNCVIPISEETIKDQVPQGTFNTNGPCIVLENV